MCKLIFDGSDLTSFTSISNIFIDNYMPQANGDYVKIYLYLLRNISNPQTMDNFSCATIAEQFSLIESDVFRALKYWEKQNLLSLTFNEDGEISCICLNSLLRNHYIMKGMFSMNNSANKDSSADYIDKNTLAQDAVNESRTNDSHANNSSTNDSYANESHKVISTDVPKENTLYIDDFAVTNSLPDEINYSKEEFVKKCKKYNIQQFSFLVETYLGKPLSQKEILDFLYMADALKFDTEFIEFIMETCIQAGQTKISQMKKVAKNYFMRGITNKTDAKADEKVRKYIAEKIYNIFKLDAVKPFEQKNIELIRKWVGEYKFSDDMIFEACNRTMERMQMDRYKDLHPFKYTDGTLKKWHQHNAKNFDDIKKVDELHKAENNKIYSKKCVKKPNANRANFTQRQYDHVLLEKALKNSQKNKRDKVLKDK